MPTVTFKTITQVTFTLDLEPTITIGDVKKKIAEERGDDYAVELQKLIYNGKIMDDTTTVGDANIEESKFVVVMLSRKKPAEAPAAPTPAAASTLAEAPKPATAPAAAPAPTPAAPAPAPARTDLTAEQTDKLENVMGMGYTRDQAIRALTISDWDANGAVNLLLSGSDDFDALPVAGALAGAEIEGDDEGDEAIGGAASLEDLANMPQLEELRNLIRSNPAALPELMRDIAQLNPQLMQAINQNQQAFLQMMTQGGGGGQAGAQGSGAGGAGGIPPGAQVIRLTPEEAAAVQRIKAMGLNVPDQLIIEAYLACDKNEELAVSYIMDAMDNFGQE